MKLVKRFKWDQREFHQLSLANFSLPINSVSQTWSGGLRWSRESRKVGWSPIRASSECFTWWSGSLGEDNERGGRRNYLPLSCLLGIQIEASGFDIQGVWRQNRGKCSESTTSKFAIPYEWHCGSPWWIFAHLLVQIFRLTTKNTPLIRTHVYTEKLVWDTKYADQDIGLNTYKSSSRK